MKKTIVTAAAAAALLLGAMTGPALADCKSEIANVRGMLSAFPTGHGGAKAVERLLEKTEKALADGKKKKCQKLVAKAKDKASSY